MYEKYRQLDGNEIENSDSSNEEAEYEIYSQDEDKKLFNENNRDLKNKNKKNIEFDGDCVILGNYSFYKTLAIFSRVLKVIYFYLRYKFIAKILLRVQLQMQQTEKYSRNLRT